MESRAFITKALLACCQSTEVFGGFWHCLAVQADYNPPQCFIAMLDIEVDLDINVRDFSKRIKD